MYVVLCMQFGLLPYRPSSEGHPWISRLNLISRPSVRSMLKGNCSYTVWLMASKKKLLESTQICYPSLAVLLSRFVEMQHTISYPAKIYLLGLLGLFGLLFFLSYLPSVMRNPVNFKHFIYHMRTYQVLVLPPPVDKSSRKGLPELLFLFLFTSHIIAGTFF